MEETESALLMAFRTREEASQLDGAAADSALAAQLAEARFEVAPSIFMRFWMPSAQSYRHKMQRQRHPCAGMMPISVSSRHSPADGRAITVNRAAVPT
jgi:hypothetical protein